jgi:aldehyde dehydrogenase (NAD+)
MLNKTKIINTINKQKIFFENGKTLDINFRIEQLKILRKAIIEFQPTLFDALYKDLNKSNFESYATEVGFVLDEIRFVLKHLKKWSNPKKVKTPIVSQPGKSLIYSEPYGVSLIISPWNYPFQLLISPLIGAISAGNCAILKPSELAEHTSNITCQMIAKFFNNEYINVIEGGIDTNKFLLEQQWDFVFYTGSISVGKIVMSACSKFLTPFILELGGKNPTIITKDADLDKAAKKITWGKFINGGQTCIAPDYLLVHKSIKNKLIEYIKKYIIEFYGENPIESIDYAKIINKKHFDRLLSLLKKGNIIFGGIDDDVNNKISPTLIDNININDPIMKEEIFGPLLPIIEFQKIQDVFNIIQYNPNPLAFYLFTNNKKTEKEVIKKIKAGGGSINDTLMHIVSPHMPFGGINTSGIGRYHGKASFEIFSNQKAILKKSNILDNPLRYPPYKDKLKFLKWFLK